MIYNFRTGAGESEEMPLIYSVVCAMLFPRADRDAHGGGGRAIRAGRAEYEQNSRAGSDVQSDPGRGLGPVSGVPEGEGAEADGGDQGAGTGSVLPQLQA